MSQRQCWSVVALVLLTLSVPIRPAAAVTVDGVIEAAYGSPLTTQLVQTNSSGGQVGGDSNRGELDFANGSELDLGYGFVADGKLNLFFSGNIALVLNANQNGTIRHVLDVFLDTAPGGQQTLNGLGAGVVVNGLTFDNGFEADYWLELEGDNNGFSGPRYWTARYAALQTPSGGTLVRLGDTQAGGPGTLTGGTNPHGILATIDNRNVAGVTAGCNGSSGSGVTTGIEWSIPLAAIGNPGGCIRVIAFVRGSSSLSNQVLAPVPVGTCALGTASNVNFASIAGDQFFSICQTVDVPGEPQTGATLSLLGPNPSRGEALRVALSLPDARAARLQLLDASGRAVRDRGVGGAPGTAVVDLSAGRRLAPGVYWLRLTHGATQVTRTISVVR